MVDQVCFGGRAVCAAADAEPEAGELGIAQLSLSPPVGQLLPADVVFGEQRHVMDP